jgi:hypothetical protein
MGNARQSGHFPDFLVDLGLIPCILDERRSRGHSHPANHTHTNGPAPYSLNNGIRKAALMLEDKFLPSFIEHEDGAAVKLHHVSHGIKSRLQPSIKVQ